MEVGKGSSTDQLAAGLLFGSSGHAATGYKVYSTKVLGRSSIS